MLPAIVQDADSGAVLMLGYMNRAALAATQASGRVTFFSRSKQRLWTKGETSGNFLEVRAIAADCDGDTPLDPRKARRSGLPSGHRDLFRSGPRRGLRRRLRLPRDPVGHSSASASRSGRRAAIPRTSSRRVLGALHRKWARKGVELALASVAQADEEVVAEAADLLYHVVLLLESRGLSLARVVELLEARHAAARAAPSP